MNDIDYPAQKGRYFKKQPEGATKIPTSSRELLDGLFKDVEDEQTTML